jgi:hypothetical protein
MTADDVLGDLADAQLDVLSAGRVARPVVAADGTPLTAYDALVRVVRRA